MKADLLKIIIKVLSYFLPSLFLYNQGSKNEKLKQAKKEIKASKKHNENRKLIVNMSDDELLEYLHKE